MEKKEPKRPTRDPNLHAGHRQRMRKQFLRAGLNGMADHQVVELMLFYAIPRRDVNELAHRLVNRFGTLSGVLDASAEELMTVPGVGEHTAEILTYFKVVGEFLKKDRTEDAPLLTDINNVALALEPHRKICVPPTVFVILLTPRARLIAAEPHSSLEEIKLRPLVRHILETSTSKVAFAECEERTHLPPSTNHLRAVRNLWNGLEMLDIPVIDYYRWDCRKKTAISYRATGLFLP